MASTVTETKTKRYQMSRAPSDTVIFPAVEKAMDLHVRSTTSRFGSADARGIPLDEKSWNSLGSSDSCRLTLDESLTLNRGGTLLGVKVYSR